MCMEVFGSLIVAWTAANLDQAIESGQSQVRALTLRVLMIILAHLRHLDLSIRNLSTYGPVVPFSGVWNKQRQCLRAHSPSVVLLRLFSVVSAVDRVVDVLAVTLVLGSPRSWQLLKLKVKLLDLRGDLDGRGVGVGTQDLESGVGTAGCGLVGWVGADHLVLLGQVAESKKSDISFERAKDKSVQVAVEDVQLDVCDGSFVNQPFVDRRLEDLLEGSVSDALRLGSHCDGFLVLCASRKNLGMDGSVGPS